ncbi:hypothetical protein BGZ93_007460 [Podila epicladia]|nr:hypothetical protein BGZ93_007460 [Podila epicladia]
MPPKRQRSGTTTHVANGAPRSMAAKKRKNTERSDDDDDSDFETRPSAAQSKPQKKTQSSKNRSKSQHSVPLPSDSSTLSLESEKQSRRGGATTAVQANGQEKENRKGTVEMKRVKRLVTEEDRGFVFTRRLPSTPAPTAVSTTMTSKTSKARNGGSAQEPEVRSVTPLPPSPERTPSREAYTHGPPTKSKPSKSQDHRSKPSVASKSAATSTSTSRPRHPPQYTPERTTDLITAIPMRETPMINKNKDLRSGSRRSSFAMRGKRASSIGNGFSDEPPPVRMKQLMAWCARKMIDNNGETKTATGHTRSATALKIAKLVEEEALARLVAGKFSVSWYSRPADLKGSKTSSKPKKPHAQNVSNLKRLQEYETQIAKLKQEDDQWTEVITSYNNFHAALLDNEPALPPGNEPIMVPESLTEDIELDLLTADERSLWDKHILKQSHQPSTQSAAKAGSSSSASKKLTREGDGPKSLNDKKWITEIMSSLETEVDQLRDTLYVASRFDKVTRQYTDQVLEQIAIALDERQRPRLMEPPLPPTPALSTSTSSSTESAIAPSLSLQSQPTRSVLSPDVADDPREILRALSRLSL